MNNLSDIELLKAEDDQAAFRILYNRYWERLYKKALSRLGNDSDAQDAVQEIFISLWRNKHTITASPTLSSYLFTALKYCIIKKVYRKAKRGVHLPIFLAEFRDPQPGSDEIAQYKEVQSIIASEVAALPDRMKEIYRLSRNENLPTPEIAQRLQLSEQTVKNTLTIALKRLRERLSHFASFLLLLL